MQSDLEIKLIKKFVIKDRQDRYLALLTNPKKRDKFLNNLYHFKDFNWKLFQEIAGNLSEGDVIRGKLKGRGFSKCYIVSVNTEFDGKEMPIDEAISEVVGQEGTILIFGQVDVVYYEAEPFDGRYIST